MKFFQAQLKKAKENKLVLATFLIIFLIGIFLRSYHFSDWLHFEIDQTYDINIVSNAAENGPENLPLLGPTAGGGRALRLGPAFYYMEYASATLFGNTPTGHAMQVLILSILSIPLFYLFCRLYFSQNISLALAAIFSFSSYLILYSRFSWSPNVLPFLVLFSFYSLLRALSSGERKKERWFLISIFSIAITSQIHFNSFFIVPSTVFFILLIKRPRFHWKIWLAAIGIFLFVYSPVVISDIKTGGENIGFFMEKFKSSDSTTKSDNKKNIVEKVVQDIRYTTMEYFLINSGIDQINGAHLTGDSWGISCKKCKNPFILRILPFLLIISSTIILLHNIWQEKEESRKNFLILLALWFFLSLFYFFSVLSDGLYIYPRFFLIMSPLAIIFIGLILEKLYFSKFNVGIVVTALAVFLLAVSNIQRIRNNFDQLSGATKKSYTAQTEDIFPDNTRITQREFLLATDYIISKYEKNEFPVYIKTDHEFEPVFWYYLKKQDIYFWNDFPKENLYAQGNYLYIEQKTRMKKKAGLADLLASFDTVEEKDFGILTVVYLKPKTEAVTSERQNENDRKVHIEDYQISQLLTWKKL